MTDSIQRVLGRAILFNAAVDLALAALLVIVFDRDGLSIKSVLFIAGVIWVLQILLAVKKMIATAIWSAWKGAKDVEDRFYDMLLASRVPPPGEWHLERLDYLAQIAQNEDYPAEERVTAAMLHSSTSSDLARSGFIISLFAAPAIDRAVQRYAERRANR